MTFRPSLKQVALLLLPAFVVTACQKEMSSTNSALHSCQLTKITYYDSAGIADSAGVQYTNGQITRVNAMDLSYTFNYNNGRVTRLDYFDNNGLPAGLYDTIAYTGNGKISGILFFSDALGPYIAVGGYDLAYNGDGTINKVTEKYLSTLTGNLVNTYEYDYTWSALNVTQVITKDLELNFADTLHYSYDNTDNYYQKLSGFIFTDHYLFGINGFRFGAFAPFLLSKNNVSTLENVPVTYTKDNQGNITELKVATERLATYDYKCP